MEYGVEVGSKMNFPVAYGYGEEEQMHGSKCIGQQWVHATLNRLDLTLPRLQEPSNFSAKIVCND